MGRSLVIKFLGAQYFRVLVREGAMAPNDILQSGSKVIVRANTTGAYAPTEIR